MEESGYMKQGLDLKRLILAIGKRFWLIPAGILFGAMLGALLYQAVTGIFYGEPVYRASADYYITFDFEEFAHGDDYYNAYTWDGILRDDPIVDHALSVLPETVTKDMVKAAVTGEMLGDYRILTVHITTSSEELSNRIAEAYEKSMTHFGEELELFKKIELWSQEEAVLLKTNTKTANAAFLGGLLLGIFVFFALLFYYLLEGAVYTVEDARWLLGYPVLGMETQKKDAGEIRILQENMEYIFQGEEVTRWKAEEFPEAQEYENLRSAKHLAAEVSWGKNNVRQVQRVLGQLELQGCKVEGIILTEVSDAFVRSYYGNFNNSSAMTGETVTR